MTPATIALIINAFSAAITEAPAIIELADKAKDLFKTLFDKGMISAELQNKIYAHVDQVCADALAGKTPDGWTVDPDPVS